MSRRIVIFIHTFFWLFHALFIYFAYNWNLQEHLWMHNFQFFVSYLVKAGLFYLNYFFIIPYFYKTRKISHLLILQFSSLLSISFLNSCIDYLFDLHFNSKFPFSDHYFWSILALIFFLCVSSGLKFGEYWFSSEASAKLLEQEKLSAEIAFLKSQINPHFLFNTLNNIYSLALINSPYTSSSITKLKDMMHYMQQDYNSGKVLLKDEIDYLNNYIALEKLRLSYNIKIDFNISGVSDDIEVEPLLFIPFVENAFKHGNVNSPDAHININLIVNGKNLKFMVSNFCQSIKKDAGSGIGLKNVQRRLELLYPDTHNLIITKAYDIFYTELNIEIDR